MSQTDVVSLEDYRGRREERLRQTLALYGGHEDRSKLLLHLWEAVELSHADRGAVLWIDEYGPGIVHAHCLLDLASARPRRSFALGPMRSAWERGIPGLLDEPDLTRTSDRILPEGPRSLCAVALGSDGARAWFLTTDSRAARSRLSSAAVEALMFAAGECASVVLHRDLADAGLEGTDGDGIAYERARRERFSGWPVLQDVEGHEGDPEHESALTIRFLITRLLRSLVDDDFAVDGDGLAQQIASVRSEIEGTVGGAAGERLSWERVLDALEGSDQAELARAVLELANTAENQGHLHGARELDRIAYDIAAAARDLDAAVEAARFLGRVSRRLGGWDESAHWYGVGRDVARAGELPRAEALALDGLGNTYRARGNFPAARETYDQVLALGVGLEDSQIEGRAHQNLMLVEKHAGRTDEALRHGWTAVRTFGTEFDVLAALTDLGDVFLRCGELGSAEAAFEVVAARSEILDARVIALDALAHIAALRGDLAGFQRRVERLTPEALASAAVEVQAEVMLFRGRSYLALGDAEVATRWLRRALEFAEERGISRVVFEAEEALTALENDGGSVLLEPELPRPSMETMSDLREPVSRLRDAPVGAFV